MYSWGNACRGRTIFFFADSLLPRPAPPELRLHARRDRHNFIDLHVFVRRIQRMAGSVEFLGRLEHGLSAEGSPSIVAGEQSLEFADDLLGGGFRP